MEVRETKDVRHGCVDCVHYPLPGGKEPCKSCRNWSAWKDKREGQDGQGFCCFGERRNGNG